jgi:hypothetical protein
VGQGQGRAPYGFGAEVSQALRERGQALRAMGIEAVGPSASAALDELERRDLGARLAREGRLAFVPDPQGMEGKVTASEVRPSGARYLLVVDEPSRRMTLVPAPPDARALEGRRVEISMDRSGRLMARQIDLDLGR